MNLMSHLSEDPISLLKDSKMKIKKEDL